MKCLKCGDEHVPETARFCPHCGTEIAAAPQPATQITAMVKAGSVEGGRVAGVEVGQVTGDVTIESTVSQIEATIVQGDYVGRQAITNNLLVLGPEALEEIVKKLSALLGVDKTALQSLAVHTVPENVSRQIAEVVAAEREVAARGIPASPQAAYHLGMLAAYRRDYDSALSYFRQATQADPEYADAFEAIAWLQQSRAMDDLRAGNYDAAVQKLADARTAAKETDPTDPQALAMRGYIAKTLAQLAERRHNQPDRDKYYAEAARLFQHATEEDPDDPSAHNGLGNVQHAMGNLDEAIAAYQRAIRLAPTYTAAWHDLALAYEGKMQADRADANTWCKKALEAWRETYRLAPNDPGFSADYLLTMGQRISWLERQCG